MTCIVGLVDKQNVYIGADSAGVAGFSLRVRADKKVFKKNGFIFGFTSSFRMGQILEYRFEPPRHHPDDDVAKFMSTHFIDGVRECLKKYGFAKKKDEEEIGGTFLVGFKGHLFVIHDDFQVGISTHPFEAVGCGEEIAVGVLYAIRKQKMTPRKKILAALEASEAFSAGVRGPFHIESI